MEQSAALSFLQSGESKVLGVMVENVQKDVGRVETSVNALHDKMSILGRLEERQNQNTESIVRAFQEITNLDVRVVALEEPMPGLKETRKWVVSGVIGIVTVVCAAVLYLVVNGPHLPL
jgi:t-SNARE complex subunit (syntaxin)